jgi:hypothetical protein
MGLKSAHSESEPLNRFGVDLRDPGAMGGLQMSAPALKTFVTTSRFRFVSARSSLKPPLIATTNEDPPHVEKNVGGSVKDAI